jgi:hypothetical protein
LPQKDDWIPFFTDEKGMEITIYGLLGHAHKLDLPLESLEVEELAAGEEFAFNGRIYEIRSVTPLESGYAINVSLVMNEATG